MILQQLFESSPGGSDNYAENLAQTIFDKRQDISSEEEVLNQAYHIVANDMGQKTARYKFSYDEDFPSDVVSNYFHLQKQGVTEDTPRVDSLVTDALKIMRGAELNDAVQALKTVLGDREYNSRRGFYNFYVRQLIDMYGKKGVAEGSGPKEKQKTPYRDINSPEYRAAADKQKQRMAKDKAAEPGKKMLAKQGVAEGGFPKKISQKEVDKFQKKHNDKLTGREVNRQEQEKKPADNNKKQGVAEGTGSSIERILAAHPEAVENFKQGGDLDYDLESDLWEYYFNNGEIRNYDADASEFISQRLADELGLSEGLDANQKRVGQLGPTEKVKNNNIGKLVGANENFINTVDQAVVSEEDEMAESILSAIKKVGKKVLDKVAPGDEELLKQLDKDVHGGKVPNRYNSDAESAKKYPADSWKAKVDEAAAPWETEEEADKREKEEGDKEPKATKGKDGSEHGGHARAKHLAKSAIPKDKEEVSEGQDELARILQIMNHRR